MKEAREGDYIFQYHENRSGKNFEVLCECHDDWVMAMHVEVDPMDDPRPLQEVLSAEEDIEAEFVHYHHDEYANRDEVWTRYDNLK